MRKHQMENGFVTLERVPCVNKWPILWSNNPFSNKLTANLHNLYGINSNWSFSPFWKVQVCPFHLVTFHFTLPGWWSRILASFGSCCFGCNWWVNLLLSKELRCISILYLQILMLSRSSVVVYSILNLRSGLCFLVIDSFSPVMWQLVLIHVRLFELLICRLRICDSSIYSILRRCFLWRVAAMQEICTLLLSLHVPTGKFCIRKEKADIR